MAIFRVNKTKDYTVMSNHHLKNKNLSLKAKGLLSQMLSLPEDWDYTVAGLCAINKESGGAMNSALKELEDNGYLRRTKIQNEKGRYEYIYDIFENPDPQNPYMENPYMDNPVMENSIQLNTNKLNTNNTNNKLLEKTPKQYGNPEINELFEEWEKCCGFKIDTKVKMNRYACQRLIKSRGFEKVKEILPYVAESQLDQYAPSINNFVDLADKWNNLGVWYKKKQFTNSMKNGKIIIPSLNERSK